MESETRNPVVRISARTRTTAVLVVPNRRTPLFVDEVRGGVLGMRAPSRHSFSTRALVGVLLIPLLLLQPFVRVYAEDATPEASSTAPATTSADSAPPPTDTSAPSTIDSSTPPPPDSSVDTTSGGASVDPSSELLPKTSNGTSATSSEESTSTELTPSNDVASTSEAATTTDEGNSEQTPISTEEATSTGGEAATSSGEIATTTSEGTATSTEETATTTPLFEEEVAASSSEESSGQQSEEGTTTPPVEGPAGPNIDQILAQKEEEMRADLRKQVEEEFTRGCVQLDAVGYYCLKEGQKKFSGDLSPSSAIASVTAETGSKGNKEIFISRGGKTMQLTDTQWDNAFPAKDLSGRFVVWQGQKDSRWQIFVATFASDTPEIAQLTDSSGSNFNPRVEGGNIVWQSWVDDNWEIYLATPHEGAAATDTPITSENARLGVSALWDVTRITQDPAHDMFPAIAGDIVTWQRAEDGGWGIYAYSMKTGVTTKISTEGTNGERPRFAMLWEGRDESGNKRLMGYDIASGEQVDLTQEARNVPDDHHPFTPRSPVSSNDQAALPMATSTTPMKVGNEDGGDGDGNATSTDATSTTP